MTLKYLLLPLTLIAATITLYPILLTASSTYLILNMENDKKLPRNFRMTGDQPPNSSSSLPSFLGFADLHISGSAQFSKNSLKKIFETVPSWNITVIDLREEPHGMLNGMAITWFSEKNWINQGMSLEKIEADEQVRFDQLRNTPMVFVYKDKTIPFPVFVRSVQSEKETVEKLGMSYIRFPTTDHKRPSDEIVDQFVTFVKNLDPGTWLHFHCSAGRGRTTTFMVMFDIMKNGPQVSLEDITKRHTLFQGLDLLDLTSIIPWKLPYKLERANFIRNFYHYAKENPNFSISWQQWLQNQKPSEK